MNKTLVSGQKELWSGEDGYVQLIIFVGSLNVKAF